MAAACFSKVKFNGIVKGFHVYKVKMNTDLSYTCFSDKQNCIDRYAFVVRCDQTEETIGHVPAKPILLNKAFWQIVQMDQDIKIVCTPRGNPRQSSHPWPELFETGGGVIQDVTFVISTPPIYQNRIAEIVTKTCEGHPIIYQQMCLTVEHSRESTPPMWLSSDPGMPDTPDYKSYTP